jgi:hypothetical protein
MQIPFQIRNEINIDLKFKHFQFNIDLKFKHIGLKHFQFNIDFKFKNWNGMVSAIWNGMVYVIWNGYGLCDLR